MQSFSIDNLIKQTFGLFTGQQSAHQDQLIYDKVAQIILGDIILFFEQNLSPSDQTQFLNYLHTSPTGLNQAITRYLPRIEEGRYRLIKRVEYTLNSLAVQSKEQKNERRN